MSDIYRTTLEICPVPNCNAGLDIPGIDHHHHALEGSNPKRYDWHICICEEGLTKVEETRIINEQTGGEKGDKLPRFDLIPPEPLWNLAEHYGKGAKKYSDRNWEKGIAFHLMFAAMMRHAWLWWNREEEDDEGFNHLDAVVFHAFALREYQETHPELDDRPRR